MPATPKLLARLVKNISWTPLLGGTRIEDDKDHIVGAPDTSLSVDKDRVEVLGIPRILAPYYLAFLLDGIALGLVMPLLPYFVMKMGANAFDLSIVVSINYLIQSVGCILMGKFSDAYGRRIAMSICLSASCMTYILLHRATSLPGVILARMVAASMGGLLPIIQSTVADAIDVDDRPKYLGRIMATLGLGLVLGPTINACLPAFSTESKILLASFLPATSLLIILFYARETKRVSSLTSTTASAAAHALLPPKSPPRFSALKPLKETPSSSSLSPIAFDIIILVINSFAIMYAFATETIYAMFMKDLFGYHGDRALSTVFAVSGILIGIFQVFFIKSTINMLGKHATLVCGNAILSLGMIGVGMIRHRGFHFAMFGLHVVGYSIADTALASLITKYSSPATQGRDLAYNQSAQACGRVISPLVAGLLYEMSKSSTILPVGALPFIMGALFPAVATLAPFYLYMKNIVPTRRRVVVRPFVEGSTVAPMKCWMDSDQEVDEEEV